MCLFKTKVLLLLPDLQLGLLPLHDHDNFLRGDPEILRGGLPGRLLHFGVIVQRLHRELRHLRDLRLELHVLHQRALPAELRLRLELFERLLQRHAVQHLHADLRGLEVRQRIFLRQLQLRTVFAFGKYGALRADLLGTVYLINFRRASTKTPR